MTPCSLVGCVALGVAILVAGVVVAKAVTVATQQMTELYDRLWTMEFP